MPAGANDPFIDGAAAGSPVAPRGLLPATTLTSRAVYTEETPIIAEPRNVWSPTAAPGEVYRSGQFTIAPALSYLYLYGDGVMARPGIDVDTSIHAIAPSVTVGLGNVWQFHYSPVWTLYSSDEFSDTVNHHALLYGQTRYQAWRLGASQAYDRTRNPLVETASQAEVERFETRGEASYDVNSRFRLQADGAQTLRRADTAADLAEWNGSLWALYETSPGTQVGAGVTGGYVDIHRRPNMSYWRLQARASSQISQKLSGAVRVGAEWRDTGRASDDTLDEPLVGASLAYRPFETTLISVDYDRSVGTSIYLNRLTQSDSAGIEFRQRLLGRFALSVSYAYREVDYLPSVDDPLGRRDQIDTFNVSLSTPLFRRVTGGVLYRYSQNETNRAEYAYESEQYGVQLRYGF